MNRETQWRPLSIVIVLYFSMGFFAASLNMLIPFFKEEYGLTQGQSQLISVAYSFAMVVVTLFYNIISKFRKKDILVEFGYTRFLLYGVFINACGLFLIPLAIVNASYALLLLAIAVTSFGTTMQMVAGNPLIVALGSADTGSQRLGISSGLNNFATTISPLIISLAIFGSTKQPMVTANSQGLILTYSVFGIVVILLAFWVSRLRVDERTISKDDNVSQPVDSDKPVSKTIWQYPQFTWGLTAMFLYCGVETATLSNMPELLRQSFDVETRQAAPYLSLFKTGLMAGKWMMAAALFTTLTYRKNLYSVLAVLTAYILFFTINSFAGFDVHNFYWYLPLIILLPLPYFISKGKELSLLAGYPVLGIVALCIAIFSEGQISLYAFMSVGLFCATLWPCLFAAAIRGLGPLSGQASTWLIMTFVGSGIVSWIQGSLAADNLLGIKLSYLVEIVGFGYLLIYALKLRSIKQ